MIGRILLRKILDERDLNTFRTLERNWFIEDEQQSFDFISNYYSTYGNLPTAQICIDHNIAVDNRDGELNYFKDRLLERHTYNLVSPIVVDLQRSLANSNLSRVRELSRDLISNLMSTDPVNSQLTKLTDLSEEEIHRVNTEFFAPEVPGITTGWPCVDNACRGLQGGGLYIMVARPNVGKTWAELYMMYNAWLQGHKSLFVSMEMSLEQIKYRLFSLISGINPSYIQNLTLGTEKSKYIERLGSVSGGAEISIMAGDLRKKVSDVDYCIELIQPEAVYIDGGYLLTPDQMKLSNSSKWEVIASIFEQLKRIAITRDVPIIVSVQLNKQGEKKNIDLSHIAGSDVISQLASLILGINKVMSSTDKLRFDMLKNRDGPIVDFETKRDMIKMDFSEIGIVSDDDIADTNVDIRSRLI